MNCKQFRQQLDRYEGESGVIELPPSLQAHLDTCASCQTHFQIHHRVLHILERDPIPALPSDFTESIIAQLQPVTKQSPVKARFTGRRLATYAGYGLLLLLALWFGYKNATSIFNGQRLPDLLGDTLFEQTQQLLTKIGESEFLQSFKHLFVPAFSFIPKTRQLIEKILGKELLPQALRLAILLIITYAVAKATVFLEGWLRQVSR
jgi:hypothetical protein